VDSGPKAGSNAFPWIIGPTVAIEDYHRPTYGWYASTVGSRESVELLPQMANSRPFAEAVASRARSVVMVAFGLHVLPVGSYTSTVGTHDSVLLLRPTT